jgi:hypothetical protein
LAVARAIGYTQGYRCQDRASLDILCPVGLDTMTVQDKTIQGKVVLRNPVEVRLNTAVVQDPGNSSLGASKMAVLAQLQTQTERKIGAHT